MRPPTFSGYPALGMTEKTQVGCALVHRRQHAGDLRGTGAAIDADNLRPGFLQFAGDVAGQMAQQGAVIGGERHLADDRNIGVDLADGVQGLDQFGQIGEGLQDNRLDPGLDQRPGMFLEGAAGLLRADAAIGLEAQAQRPH